MTEDVFVINISLSLKSELLRPPLSKGKWPCHPTTNECVDESKGVTISSVILLSLLGIKYWEESKDPFKLLTTVPSAICLPL